MASAYEGSRNLATVAIACLVVLGAAAAGATPPGHGGRSSVAGRGSAVAPPPQLYGPAGPTPLNPAGPTPLNPAGPPPLNPAGPPPLGTHLVSPRRFVPYQQPGMYVGVVGGGYGQGGSFYCQVHNRGYASQGMFLNHLADFDGVYGDDAVSLLVEDGGVWVFPAQ
ncbi:hypothetical protein K2Z84_34670 [Candidatus Binatia bacterium]|jgi:hypothetical protein|nr:hypothetical protein [Candidatus Binatia bacterium]